MDRGIDLIHTITKDTRQSREQVAKQNNRFYDWRSNDDESGTK